jgi:ABC-2 type transport system ATP-binding protein
VNDSVIEAKDLRKTYGDFVAVDGISFGVQQGEIFGLLGPNGAGKTTTLESLEGLRAPDSGTLRVAGVDPTRESRKLRNLIGVQLQSAGLPESITPDEAMRFFCAYHSVAPLSWPNILIRCNRHWLFFFSGNNPKGLLTLSG